MTGPGKPLTCSHAQSFFLGDNKDDYYQTEQCARKVSFQDPGSHKSYCINSKKFY